MSKTDGTVGLGWEVWFLAVWVGAGGGLLAAIGIVIGIPAAVGRRAVYVGAAPSLEWRRVLVGFVVASALMVAARQIGAYLRSGQRAPQS